jgi:glutamate dehydrogenase
MTSENLLESVVQQYKSCSPFASTKKDPMSRTEILHDANLILESYKKKSRLLDITVKKECNILKIFNPLEAMGVSFAISILDSFGIDVISQESIEVQIDGHTVHVQYYNFSWSTLLPGTKVDTTHLQNSLLQRLNGHGDNDKLNRLSYLCGLDAKGIMLIKAYIAYAKQVTTEYSPELIRDTLITYHQITEKMMSLFAAKFNPSISASKRDAEMQTVKKNLEHAISEVKNHTAVKMLTYIAALVNATIRTNYFLPHRSDFVSFKLKGKLVPNLPKPVTFAEIFVFSDLFEAIHLRNGPVARGGIRWSNRNQDYRTEVLGLVKTQTAKNSIVVPTGAKGGFYIKNNVNDKNIGIESYQTFLRGVLDITDNIVNGKVIRPQNVVAHDEDDPYLVVAADKGTATFSDHANKISEEYGFWLGDAFASGGSYGYDHKKLGITAKGAWKSVECHFAECGIDINKPFTVTGIGGLNGDVFGNGVIYSKNIALVAAFNHEHIFIDPTPDLPKSYQERCRLFKNGKLSWGDYDKNAISKGGGVFDRFGDDIKITPEMRQLLDIAPAINRVTPEEMIRYILQANVDLLWNGGIGTFIKAKNESNASVADSFNDAIRINGGQLAARVIGEGGNLGMTQLGRVEYATSGGHVNTDAVDNCAGVNCSDHEVNIKIALNQAVRDKFITFEERNKALRNMSKEVEELVLSANDLQNQAISIARLSNDCGTLLHYKSFIAELERLEILDRATEFLPDDAEISRRAALNLGFTRPELAILLNYGKIYLSHLLIKTDIESETRSLSYLEEYFPSQMQDKFGTYIRKHPLRKNIIVTNISNEIVDRLGITVVWDIMQVCNVRLETVIKTYILVKDIFHINDLWHKIDSIKNSVDAAVRYNMHATISEFMQRAIHRIINLYADDCNIQDIISQLAEPIEKLRRKSEIGGLNNANRQYYENIAAGYINRGVPEKLARAIAAMSRLRSIVSIAHIAYTTGMDVDVVAAIFYEIDTMFDLFWLRKIGYEIKTSDYLEWCSIVLTSNLISEAEAKLCTHLIVMARKSRIKDPEAILANFKAEYSKQIKAHLLWYNSVKIDNVRVPAVLHIYLNRFNSLFVNTLDT